MFKSPLVQGKYIPSHYGLFFIKKFHGRIKRNLNFN